MDLALFFLPVLISVGHYLLADVRKLHPETCDPLEYC